MSGLEEVVELAAEKMATQAGDDWRTLGPLGKMSWREEALAVLLAAAPALLRAVVAELPRVNFAPAPERVEFPSSESDPPQSFATVPPAILAKVLLAALSRLSPAKEETP